ncbi:magnesium transporter [Candidatus Peregrinibacteria bacterium]|nr:magnesium transporter [Candidatus Peregrinibacteria bacterium]
MEEDIKEHPFSTDTAEKHMVRHLCTGKQAETVEDFLKKLRKCASPLESLTDIYVTNEHDILLGVIDLAKLLKSDPARRLGDLMKNPVVTIHPHTDRERAARLAIHYELDTLPVIDKEKHLLGVIPTQSILKILHEEHVEDALRAAGFRHAHEGAFIDVLKARTLTLIRVRTPWLLVGLVGGMFAAFIVSFFEGALAQEVTLAFFIPAMLYMAAAVGTQSEAMYLRLYDTGNFRLKSYLIRETAVGFGIGLIASTLIFLFILLFLKNLTVALIVSISMLISTLMAVIIATIIPAILAKFKKDPAIGTGPFATVMQDILTVAVYFLVASFFL